MKKLVLLLAVTLTTAGSSFAEFIFPPVDPSISEVRGLYPILVNCPVRFVVEQHLEHGDPLLGPSFTVTLYSQAHDPFLNPEVLAGAVDQALSLNFDRFFFVQIFRHVVT